MLVGDDGDGSVRRECWIHIAGTLAGKFDGLSHQGPTALGREGAAFPPSTAMVGLQISEVQAVGIHPHA